MFTIIIPTLNEAECIARTLASIAELDGDFEVLVADGASTDGTVELVRSLQTTFPKPLQVLTTERHRARQLNRAAAAAQGSVLVFLHADTVVSGDALEKAERALCDSRVIGGNFDLIFEGDYVVERLFTWIYRVRRPFGIYYGDSGIFVRREVFEEMCGYQDIPIMDDYEFVRRLERRGKTAFVRSRLRTSARRWRVQGLFKTLASWVWVQALFSLGFPAERLARWYKPVRDADRRASHSRTATLL